MTSRLFKNRRKGTWYYARRVPPKYHAVDQRNVVQQTTGVRISADPHGVAASRIAEQLDHTLELYWKALASADADKAKAEYHAACQAAIKLHIPPPADQSQRTISELLARIELLENDTRLRQDPITAKAVLDAVAVPTLTFRECAEQYIAVNKAGWSNAKHAKQWASSLETYAYPVISNTPVERLSGPTGTHLINRILRPIWYTKPTTASRLRGRIEKVLDWAKVRGYRDGDNPARWKGHLDTIYPTAKKVQPVKHHAAMPYRRLPEFMAKLRQQEGIGARALELTILTAARTSEVLLAKRTEIDREARMWIVPPERMKKRREHRVPLCEAALAIIDSLPQDGEYLFPAQRRGAKHLDHKTMLRVLERMGESDAVTHGFRSSFRDWGAEEGDYPPELMKLATAHRVGDDVENAYRRGSMLKKRQALMADWERYCTSGRSCLPGLVPDFHRRAAIKNQVASVARPRMLSAPPASAMQKDGTVVE